MDRPPRDDIFQVADRRTSVLGRSDVIGRLMAHAREDLVAIPS